MSFSRWFSNLSVFNHGRVEVKEWRLDQDIGAEHHKVVCSGLTNHQSEGGSVVLTRGKAAIAAAGLVATGGLVLGAQASGQPG